jgi:hypothetical protein
LCAPARVELLDLAPFHTCHTTCKERTKGYPETLPPCPCVQVRMTI